MTYSINSYMIVDGNDEFDISFEGDAPGYLEESHVKYYIDNIKQPNEARVFLTPTRVKISPVPLDGVGISFRRESSIITPLVDWLARGQITERNLDRNTTQLLYLAQELKDTGGGTASTPSIRELLTTSRTEVTLLAGQLYVTLPWMIDAALKNCNVIYNAVFQNPVNYTPVNGLHVGITTGLTNILQLPIAATAGDVIFVSSIDSLALGELPGSSGDVTSVNGLTGAVVLTPDTFDDTATVNKFTTAADTTKLAGIEAGADVNNISNIDASDLTDGGETTLHTHAGGATAPVASVNGEVGTVVLNPDHLDDTATTNKFTTTGDITKLAGIEAGADVNNISNIDASDLTDGGETTLHTHAGGATAPVASVNGEVGVVVLNPDHLADTATTNKFTTEADITKLGGITPLADVSPVTSVNAKSGVVVLDADDISDSATTHKFTTAGDISKLSGIDADADVNNISDANATDLTDGNQTTLHHHAIPVETGLITHITRAATGSLSADDCSGTVIHNAGQSAANTQTLPAANAGYNFIAQIGTAGTGAFNLKAGAGDKIHFDGTALDDADKVSNAAPVVGDYITFWTIYIGSAWEWMATSGQGTWTDGGA